jgi:hypothetical protein
MDQRRKHVWILLSLLSYPADPLALLLLVQKLFKRVLVLILKFLRLAALRCDLRPITFGKRTA